MWRRARERHILRRRGRRMMSWLIFTNMEPSQLSPCSFPSRENAKKIQYCSSKSSLLQQRCLFFCYIRGVYSPIYCVSHTSGPQDCSLKSPFQQQGCLFFRRIRGVYSYCVAHSSQPQGSPTLKDVSTLSFKNGLTDLKNVFSRDVQLTMICPSHGY